MRKITILLLVLSFVFAAFSINAQELHKAPRKDKICKRLQNSLERMKETDEINVWVFFTDKGIFTRDEYENRITQYKNNLSERRRRRREKTGKAEIVNLTDLSVNRDYIRKIEETGAKRRIISNWLNGASFRVNQKEIEEIKYLPFVLSIERVEKFYLTPEPYEPAEKIMEEMDIRGILEFNYGGSERQDSLIAVDIAHSHGYFGDGVRIGLLDDGFMIDTTRFEALGIVSKRIIDTWDFINDTSFVGHLPGEDPNQCAHGTSMLSLIAGFKDNELIGPAFNAEFALAKTEIRGLEIIQEEDNWVKAAEWAESCGPDSGGVDIISSSLGYKVLYDTINHSYSDMDGNTTKITKAADLAASKGIIVVTAMGNISSSSFYHTSRPDTCIVAPADADSVISAGAVDFNPDANMWKWAWTPVDSILGYGATIGPTYDGRRKPEVCASWKGHHINPDYNPSDTSNQHKYVTGRGTSVATALIAGGCALILQAHPEWSAMKVRNILLNTASQHSSPDDTLGWGIANIWEAINYETTDIPSFAEDEFSPFYPNPFIPKEHSQVVIPFNIMNQGRGGKIYIYSISGIKIREIHLSDNLSPGRYLTPDDGAATWDGKDENGNYVDSGIYILLLRTGYAASAKKLAVIR